jgi:hypothetical protein
MAAQIRIMLAVNATKDPMHEIRATLRLPTARVKFIFANNTAGEYTIYRCGARTMPPHG